MGFLLLLNQPNPCDHLAEGELCRRKMYRERIETRGEEDRKEKGEASQKQADENINGSFLCIAGCSQGCKVLREQIILKIKLKYRAMDFSFKNSLHIPPNFYNYPCDRTTFLSAMICCGHINLLEVCLTDYV